MTTIHEPGAPDNMHDCIIIVWHINDVRELRPELTDDQCREVLRRCDARHDAGIGIDWNIIQEVAEECFPYTGEAGQ